MRRDEEFNNSIILSNTFINKLNIQNWYKNKPNNPNFASYLTFLIHF
jgi:hypothetical protein